LETDEKGGEYKYHMFTQKAESLTLS